LQEREPAHHLKKTTPLPSQLDLYSLMGRDGADDRRARAGGFPSKTDSIAQ
jgi:hypothetical protein